METRNYPDEQEVKLLHREESHFLDFKRAEIRPGKLQEAVVVLANADGACIRAMIIDLPLDFPLPY
jgi:hypothetical protein